MRLGYLRPDLNRTSANFVGTARDIVDVRGVQRLTLQPDRMIAFASIIRVKLIYAFDYSVVSRYTVKVKSTLQLELHDISETQLIRREGSEVGSWQLTIKQPTIARL
jgi:hypothetical protein